MIGSFWSRTHIRIVDATEGSSCVRGSINSGETCGSRRSIMMRGASRFGKGPTSRIARLIKALMSSVSMGDARMSKVV